MPRPSKKRPVPTCQVATPPSTLFICSNVKHCADIQVTGVRKKKHVATTACWVPRYHPRLLLHDAGHRYAAPSYLELLLLCSCRLTMVISCSVWVVLPVRDCRRTHRNCKALPHENDLLGDGSPAASLPHRPLSFLADCPGYLLPLHLPWQYAAVPLCQAHGSSIHCIMRYGRLVVGTVWKCVLPGTKRADTEASSRSGQPLHLV